MTGRHRLRIWILLTIFVSVTCRNETAVAKTTKPAKSGPYKSIVVRIGPCDKPSRPYIQDLPSAYKVELYNTSKKINLLRGNITILKETKTFKMSLKGYYYEKDKWQLRYFFNNIACNGVIVKSIYNIMGLRFDEDTCAVPKKKAMTKSTDDFTKSSDKRPRSTSRESSPVPLHFEVHKPGCHLESCCGVCNLFPGVLLIAFCQVLVGSILLTLILTHGKQYDKMHQTPSSQFISIATGAVLTGVTGAGVLLIIVALTENCRAMLIYLLVATMVWIGLMSIAMTKIGRACVRFKEAPKIKDEQHRLANLACVSGLFTFFGAVLYFFSFMVVFSFYHFRYVRRAILLHEAECE